MREDPLAAVVNTGAGTAATGEQVNFQFFFEWQAHAWLSMEENGFLLLYGHRCASSPNGYSV
ncbi:MULTISPECIES: hypothetical protein [unclassified Pseudomonas]|uniref:hypothetical protein n=1 Tax=unclassified Pseudomonas TaxID=196821 RepID=UPI001CBD5ACA|nr:MULTISPECIES: hypothetical protein [unclassified Pseudomonas]